jgi:GH25 family lysozyme M1 (1,4-beta-N-acetylmuramidase)
LEQKTVKNEIEKTEPKRSRRKKRSFKSKLKLAVAVLIVLLVLTGIIKLAAFLGSISKTHLSDEGLTHDARFKNCVAVHGIDVSEYQDEINWKKVKSSEADFVFIRAGYRSSETGELKEDADFKTNMKKANKAGIMCGAYFFSQALNEAEAVEEAEYLLKLVKRYDVEMPLVIDYELLNGGRLQKVVEAGEMPASSMYHDVVLAFCRRVEKAGYESAVYANYDMLTNYMDSTLLDEEAVIWAAQYGGQCDVKGNYLYWQCAEDAAVGGIEGNVDHDIWYIEPGKVYSTRAEGKKDPVSIGECKVEFDQSSYKTKNHIAKPEIKVTNGDKKLRRGRDYIASFVKNTGSGTGYAIVRGKGRYKDWIAVPFTID